MQAKRLLKKTCKWAPSSLWCIACGLRARAFHIERNWFWKVVSFEHRCGRRLHKRTRSGLSTQRECYLACMSKVFGIGIAKTCREWGGRFSQQSPREWLKLSHAQKQFCQLRRPRVGGWQKPSSSSGSFFSCCERSLTGNRSLIPVCLTHSFLRACCCESSFFHNRFNLILASTLPSTWIWRPGVPEQPFLETPPAQLYSIPIGTWL